jgi:hypothetical protein
MDTIRIELRVAEQMDGDAILISACPRVLNRAIMKWPAD